MSGGSSAAKGYFLQALMAVLKSLEDNDWITVTLEPEDKVFKQKVDICWDYPKGIKKVAQVKSTKNIFRKKNIVTVIKEVISKYPLAKDYSFILIGNCEIELQQFIDNINNMNYEQFIEDENLLELKPYNIRIQKVDFNYDLIENKLQTILHKNMSTPVTYETINSNISRLSYNFQKYTSKPLTRNDLNKWIDSYSDLLQLDKVSRNVVLLGELDRYFATSKDNAKEEILMGFKKIKNKMGWDFDGTK